MRLKRIADRGQGPVSLAAAFLLGILERNSGFGLTWDHPLTRRSRVYDAGRNLLRHHRRED